MVGQSHSACRRCYDITEAIVHICGGQEKRQRKFANLTNCSAKSLRRSIFAICDVTIGYAMGM